MSPPQDHHFPVGGGGGAAGGTHLKLKDTELSLTLALPGSSDNSSNNNSSSNNNKLTLDLLPPSKAGAKRGFSDAIDNFGNAAAAGASASPAAAAAASSSKPSSKDNKPSSAKAQVVGWPPIRSYRKNTMATATTQLKTKDEASSAAPEPKQNTSSGCLYVKVSMDGAPYLRKVDLKLYSGYKELSIALEKMFSGFTSGGSKDESLTESRTKDLLNKSEYVLTYEDKDGDWMLVGDVPWVMFVESCKKLKIMKGSDAIGLAPRAKNQS